MRSAIVAILFILASPLFAQSGRGDAYISNGVFIRDSTIKEVCDLWQDYLHSRPDSLYDNPYWNAEEKKRYKYFDLLTQTEINNVYIYLRYYHPTILSINPEGEYFRVRTMFARGDTDFSDPIAITNVYAKRESGKFKLYNSLPIVTRSWQRQTIGSITFVFPPYHHFNQALAAKLSAFVDSIAKKFASQPKPTEYYFADSFDELMKAQGFDYYIGEGNKRVPSGYSDFKNAIMYGGGADEWFPHEFVHLYALPKFPKADDYFHEGIATLLGGSRGYSLEWHIHHADSILRCRDFNIDSSFRNSFQYGNLDYITGSDYVFGGLICKMLIDKGGWDSLMKFARMENKTDARFQILKEEFGVERKDVATFMRRKISEYAKK